MSSGMGISWRMDGPEKSEDCGYGRNISSEDKNVSVIPRVHRMPTKKLEGPVSVVRPGLSS